MAQITSSVTFIPSEYDSGTFTTSGSYPASNGLSNTSSTSYARFTVATTSQYAIYNIGVYGIPSNATINSITCQAKISYSGGGITTKTIQLYAGSTAKGSAATINVSGTSNVTLTNITTGTWTAQELQNAKLRINGQKGNGNNRYIYFYGATLTVNYTYTLYGITATSNTQAAVVDPLNQTVVENDDAMVIVHNVSDLSKIAVKDNDVDVTNSLVAQQGGTTITLNPSAYDGGVGTVTDQNKACTDTSSTTYSQLRLSGGTCYMFYKFSVPPIVKYATIDSVTCSAKVAMTATSSSITNKAIQLYSGDNAKGSAYTIGNTTAITTANLTVGSWTGEELENIRIRLSGTYNGANSYYFNFYGADLTITYTVQEGTYIYTISNVQADHVITVEDAITAKPLYLNVGGTMKLVSSIQKKTNDVWETINLIDFWRMVNGSYVNDSSISGKTTLIYGGEIETVSYDEVGTVNKSTSELTITINDNALQSGTYKMFYEDTDRNIIDRIDEITEFTI